MARSVFKFWGPGHSYAPCGCVDRFVDQEANFIKEFEHWFLVLNQQQAFLGRSLLILKEHKIDEIELTDAEVAEKHEVYCEWRKAVGNAFSPDKINQALSGNEDDLHRGHLHWHFIPRYRHPVAFAEVNFFMDSDETRSKPIAKFSAKVEISTETRTVVRDEFLKFLA